MTGCLFDTNVLLDVITADPEWLVWSKAQIATAAARNLGFINPIIYAEVAPAFESKEALERWFSGTTFRRLALPYQAAWRASEAFGRYRRSGGTRTLPLPDFYIGAHAEASGLTVVTRDASRYATYFPKVQLIAP